MEKFKELKIPHESGNERSMNVVRERMCDSANSSDCDSLLCSECLFGNSNAEQFKEWYNSKNKKDE